ncbi:hypothetical protein PoB_004579900 [Plakobranchus ocellatus]|uniref:Uncharacterized protein n=1 Tax=Plakobranchus ocellatus TaxID=259542 RepID=A0AAV4BGS5_9GAST|nr:hypothetical protein PoB_004579900 [Plakobranchus ocellatus]
MPYAKNNQDDTPGSPMLGLSVEPTLLYSIINSRQLSNPRANNGNREQQGDCCIIKLGDIVPVIGTLDSKPTLRSIGTLLSQIEAQPLAPWPDGRPESLRSPCCGHAT